MKKYFAYIRVSTKKQDVSPQRDAIEKYAAANGLVIAAWFEEKQTAAKLGRTIFTRMLAELERGSAEGLIVHKIDRSARNLKDWANLGVLIDRGVDVRFAHDSLDLHSRGGRLSADVQAIVAADYIRNLREEVMKGQRSRLTQGFYPFAAPVGYLDQGKEELKTPDPIAAPLVRLAFQRYATGTIGLKDLRIEMQRRGLRSPRSGKPLSLATLSSMLNNPFYIGLIHIRRTGTTYQGKHKPIIRKALFDRVQDILKGKLVTRIFKHDFLFRRAVRCGTCGYHLIGERHRKVHVYYRCHSEGCGVSIREDMLNHAVETALLGLECSPDEQAAARELAAELAGDHAAELDKLRRSLSLQLAACEARLEKLTDAYLEEAIARDLYERRKRNILMEQRSLRDRSELLSEKGVPANRALENLERANMAYSGFRMGNMEEKREVVDSVTSNIVVSGKNPMIELQNPFQGLLNWRNTHFGAPSRATPRQRAKQLLDILGAVDEQKRKPAMPPENNSRVA